MVSEWNDLNINIFSFNSFDVCSFYLKKYTFTLKKAHLLSRKILQNHFKIKKRKTSIDFLVKSN